MARMRRFSTEPALALVALALLMVAVLETVQLATQYETLAGMRAAQGPSLSEVGRVRRQLDALAGETARLAAAGNAGAQAVVDEMRQQGVTLHPPAEGH
jgi:hypothetical protein